MIKCSICDEAPASEQSDICEGCQDSLDELSEWHESGPPYDAATCNRDVRPR